MSYEALVADPEHAVRTVGAAILPTPPSPDLVDKVVQGSAFQNMKAKAEELAKEAARTNTPGHLRAGKAGRWKEHFGDFDASLLQSLKDKFALEMKGTGLSWPIGDGDATRPRPRPSGSETPHVESRETLRSSPTRTSKRSGPVCGSQRSPGHSIERGPFLFEEPPRDTCPGNPTQWQHKSQREFQHATFTPRGGEASPIPRAAGEGHRGLHRGSVRSRRRSGKSSV